ncbi:MAG TPA: UDP-N-acetylglucosamine 1-carboxyvinyltransferase [Pseudobdellovibrionaceae bacterium]|nr:UDP-N-acetylglucosamine 1-carboxyvinyltransferase [Pseudobdellovibrionaceae bacterium]
MDRMRVVGGKTLRGEVRASGAKNSALKMLFASLLAEGRHEFSNVPDLKDVDSSFALLESLNCKARREGDRVIIDVAAPGNFEAHYDLVRKMRASILCLGPLLAKYGQAQVSLPGGCAIGSRPINLHLEGMKALGAEIELKNGYVHASVPGGRLQGGQILFEFATVGGTENVMMAATLANGTTYIENAAKEPEIVDLANYLNKMGAKISGAGTSIIRVDGVKSLNASQHRVIPDRIEAGTLLLAGAIAGGDVTVTDCVPDDLDALLAKLREAGHEIHAGPNQVRIKSSGGARCVDITTAPHPGFPTDLQAQFMSLMCVSEGVSVISETVFENRFMHVTELLRLGADITPKTRVAVVRGKPGGLEGAPVMATDLRASACLVLAGLAARGETVVNRIYHLDRGYEKLENKLSSLGAAVERF